MDKKEVGFRIREIRKQNKMTQIEFADRLSISQSYLSSVESGREEATGKLIKLICFEFHILKDWLCEGRGEMHSEQRSPQVFLTNQALAQVTSLLTTPSRERYNRYVNILYHLSNVMKPSGFKDEAELLLYLDALEGVLESLDLYVQKHVNEGETGKTSAEYQADVTNNLSDLFISIQHVFNTQYLIPSAKKDMTGD